MRLHRHAAATGAVCAAASRPGAQLPSRAVTIMTTAANAFAAGWFFAGAGLFLLGAAALIYVLRR